MLERVAGDILIICGVIAGMCGAVMCIGLTVMLLTPIAKDVYEDAKRNRSLR